MPYRTSVDDEYMILFIDGEEYVTARWVLMAFGYDVTGKKTFRSNALNLIESVNTPCSWFKKDYVINIIKDKTKREMLTVLKCSTDASSSNKKFAIQKIKRIKDVHRRRREFALIEGYA